ncbi:flagellar biosynthesis protein FlhF [Desulfopila sp. IMCC35006]|uniref:flagellar biosynthesis protein FlhF n=1 Tax=Desulfopila sp. IMCC35006 TaxID=2569542 RepID=UPI0010AD5BE1|nr:flagellar biosynthesis protein FlhF [Desulfopila sp. IMCC35006]TKB25811.1 flagellar biosynthesis protein FlhF [Desulfopila sp. IMCC35006]
MQVRVFQSADMASGLKQIKQELGPDALILSTRTVRNGKLGILGKPMLEITAAIDADLPQTKQGVAGYPGSPRQASAPAADARRQKIGFRHTVDDAVDGYLNEPPATNYHPYSRAVSRAATPEREAAHPAMANDPGLQSEVNELKKLVKSLAGQITDLAEKESVTHSARHAALQVKGAESASRPTGNPLQGDHILTTLIDRGINVETSRTIAGFLRQSLTDLELCDSAHVQDTIISTIADLIAVKPPVFAAKQQQQRIALVGPTGVGKTTTLAKIAANYLSKYSHSIALITIDTYRIAAVEQLKVYGEIMRLPVDVVINPEQLERAINRHSDKELILIDTAGRSPRDSYCIEELASFLPEKLDIDKHLVLSAGSRENELVSTIKRFNTLGISNTIFTKIDECASLGVLLNIQIQNSSPLSWVTNGQRVPEDLLEASPEIIAQLIMSQHEGSQHD